MRERERNEGEEKEKEEKENNDNENENGNNLSSLLSSSSSSSTTTTTTATTTDNNNNNLLLSTTSLIPPSRLNTDNKQAEYMEKSFLLVITHLTMLACRLLLLTSVYSIEQSLLKRGFDLLQTILTLTPHAPLKLQELEDNFTYKDKTLMTCQVTRNIRKYSE